MTPEEQKIHDILHKRNKLELWCDQYNHTFALIRTIIGFIGVIALFFATK